MRRSIKTVARLFLDNNRASTSTEFAAAATVLLIGVLNTLDVGYYAYKRMLVQNSAEVGGQAAWKTCNDPSTMLPATQKCSGLNAAVTSSIQSTSLGTSVSLVSGYPKEGYYCATASNSLQSVGTLSSKPADCSAAGNASGTPGDYVQIEVTYKFTPLFGMTAVSALGISSITATSWMRLG